MASDKPIEVIYSGIEPGNRSKILAEVLESLSGKLPTVQDKDLEGPAKAHAKSIADSFTSGVDFLRSSFPNESIRSLMALVWDLCGSRIVPLAMGPQVPGLSFGKMGVNGVIFAPDNWVSQIQADALYQMGAIVFVGSQAVDFYNGLMSTKEEARKVLFRARLYESEYLRTLQGIEGHSFNPYQQAILHEYPEGLASAPSLVYTSKPFVAPS